VYLGSNARQRRTRRRASELLKPNYNYDGSS
jgi:hypothetical protein